MKFELEEIFCKGLIVIAVEFEHFSGSSSCTVKHEKIKLGKTNYLYDRHKCNIQHFYFLKLNPAEK